MKMMNNEIERSIQKYGCKIDQAQENISEWKLLVLHYRELLAEQETNTQKESKNSL